MDVILDDLTTLQFFDYGGVVKLNIDSIFAKECNIKPKYTFFDAKSYIHFFNSLYLTYLNLHKTSNSEDTHDYVNKCIEIFAYIGKSIYTVDFDSQHLHSYEFAKFYYTYDKTDKIETESKDPYGIKNVNFSKTNENDGAWKDYTRQRLERGFDDSELWDFDETIAKFIYPRLKEFEKKEHKFPNGLTSEEWHNILKDMIIGFEYLTYSRKLTEEETEKSKNGLELFSKYFKELWY